MNGWIFTKKWLVLSGCLLFLSQPACESVKSNISSLTGENEEAEYEETDIAMTPIPQLHEAYRGKKLWCPPLRRKTYEGYTVDILGCRAG